MAERNKTNLLLLTAEHRRDPTYQFQFLDALPNGTATSQDTRTGSWAAHLVFSQRSSEDTGPFLERRMILRLPERTAFYAMQDAGRETDIDSSSIKTAAIVIMMKCRSGLYSFSENFSKPKKQRRYLKIKRDTFQAVGAGVEPARGS